MMSTIPPIRHSTFITVPPDVVYDAIATAEGLDRWFTCGTEIEPRPGGSIRLRWKNFGAGRWTLEDGGEVLEAVPSRRFVFKWTPGKSETTVAFDIESHPNGSMITVTELGYTSDPEDIQAMLGCATGWGEALTLLKFHLESGLRYEEVPDRA